MAEQSFPFQDLREEEILRTLVEGTATETGELFFQALVKSLAQALNVQGAWITEYLEDQGRLRSLAFWLKDGWVEHYEYDIAGTPCEPVVTNATVIHIPENVVTLYPRDPDLREQGAVSYMGFPLKQPDGKVLGHMAVLDQRAMPEQPRNLALFRIFASRATAELIRIRAQADLRQREEKLARLVSSAMDAIIELDSALVVVQMNPAAEKMFRTRSEQMLKQKFTNFLQQTDRSKLSKLTSELLSRRPGEKSFWIAGGFQVRCPDGEEFQAEATASCSELGSRHYYTLILRNVNERLQAEQKIQRLTREAEYLRDEIRALENFGDIIGQSEPLLRVLDDVHQVAATEATVLISGETGTGKELIARAIHSSSKRKAKPLIKVNCAAIPAGLIESEFFGHEKGAFTGATARREGRFALADGGTIFLDEIGELPLDLQSKLLRVLQEGEFEMVGSSTTRRVDVRVIAATNRNLQTSMQERNFREDLYYRLNVFPIQLPPLRERTEDIPLLAADFAEKYAAKIGRHIEPLDQESIRRLMDYDWPGNIRELQNIVERAVITSRDGRLSFDRAFPTPGHDISKPQSTVESHPPAGIRTLAEMEELERINLRNALEKTGWKVAGKNGAAELLKMNASTLSSRMKALGIRRP